MNTLAENMASSQKTYRVLLSPPPPSLQPAVPGNLSAPKDERSGNTSAASDTAAADCIWDYASIQTVDYALMPTAPVLRRFGSRLLRAFHR